MQGEIFDYEIDKLSLIRKGHKFKYKNNDAEFCLHLFEEKGKSAFERLNGSFCIIIYNLITGEFFIISDRFGSYLFFYCLTKNGTLMFATQLSSILVSSEVSRELDVSAVFEFFNYQKVLGTKTFINNARTQPPATILHYSKGNITLTQYWKVEYDEEGLGEKEYINELAATIEGSVKRLTNGNHRFGILLSGGLDSRMILAALKKEVVCFTFSDFKNRELKIAKEIAASKNCRHLYLKREIDHYINLVDQAVEISDGMQCFFHAHAIGFFDQLKEQCDILLHGYAIERLFRGTQLPNVNFRLFGKNLYSRLDKLSNNNLCNEIIVKTKTSLYELRPHQLFTKEYASVFDEILFNSTKAVFKGIESSYNNIYDKFNSIDLSYPSRARAFLFENSLRAFMDERNIVFDNNMFDLYTKTPFKFRANSKTWKKALHKLNPEISHIPDANTGYSPFMPKALEDSLNFAKQISKKMQILRDPPLPNPTYTQGSWPNAKILRYNETMKKEINDTIHDPTCLNPDIFNIQRIREIYKEYLNGNDAYIGFLFLLLTFGKWYRKYGQ
jgi:asparagine synthase (glutamine-hydrolysing)